MLISGLLHGDSVGLPHDGTVCTFTMCCISLMLQQPLTCMHRCRQAGIGDLWCHTNRKVFCRVESLLMYRFLPATAYFCIQKVFVCRCNSIVIQANPESNQCVEKQGRSVFVILGWQMSCSGNYGKVRYENPPPFPRHARPRPVSKGKASPAQV